MKVFKFKKYKDEYENGRQGATLRDLFEVETFLASRGIGSALAHGLTGASPLALSSDIALSVIGLSTGDVLTAGAMDRCAIEGADLPTSSSEI